jgi:hypothetical protein
MYSICQYLVEGETSSWSCPGWAGLDIKLICYLKNKCVCVCLNLFLFITLPRLPPCAVGVSPAFLHARQALSTKSIKKRGRKKNAFWKAACVLESSILEPPILTNHLCSRCTEPPALRGRPLWKALCLVLLISKDQLWTAYWRKLLNVISPLASLIHCSSCPESGWRVKVCEHVCLCLYVCTHTHAHMHVHGFVH